MGNGAELIVRLLAEGGIDHCFANPGTTEVPLLAALGGEERIRLVLGLFEGVVTGAADGYFRAKRRPAVTLTHLGPGFAHGCANLHNARRAGSGVLNFIGNHPRSLQELDPPLNSDVFALAKVFSDSVEVIRSSTEISGKIPACIRQASQGKIVSVIVEMNALWEEVPDQASDGGREFKFTEPLNEEVGAVLIGLIAKLIQKSGSEGRSLSLLLGGAVLANRRALAVVGAIHRQWVTTHPQAPPMRLLCETFPGRLETGMDLPTLERVPYSTALGKGFFESIDELVLVGAKEPVAYFAEQHIDHKFLSASTKKHVLSNSEQDSCKALELLACALDTPIQTPSEEPMPRMQPQGALTTASLMAALAWSLPEEAILIDEAVSMAGMVLNHTSGALSLSYMTLTGGSCGMGLPCAIGAALASPERKVIALVGDGSAMYANQAIWTQARERLDIINVVLSNRCYRILQNELQNRAGSSIGQRHLKLTQLTDPGIDWVGFAKAQGMTSAHLVRTTEELLKILHLCFNKRGPHLIEADLSSPG